ncbi:MAG: hypothetical protein F4Z04_08725 [Acidobacteria bacterium]|nr:hypothetical protein [Acidobacteriota bacterium]
MRRFLAPVLLIACALWPVPAGAQDPGGDEPKREVTLVTDFLLYADNTEFFNPFRDGETLFGAAGTLAVNLPLSDYATLRGGVFLNHRYGSERFAERARPVISLSVRSGASTFTIGTLHTVPDDGAPAPDLTGPHGLLPPLQVETLAFTRPNEGGVQWQVDSDRLEQDAWINWQRLNTAEHRERFDAGVRGRVPVGDLPIAFGYQFHHTHEGGQLFDTGPVRDSLAGGPGVILEPPIDGLDSLTIDTYVLLSKHVADRTVQDDPNEHGHGVFFRAAAVKNGWRGHFIFWSGCLWLKDEGDPNYGSRRQDGTVFRPTRHYGEVGLARTFYEADGVTLDGALRFHRIERDYDYSFRILARIDTAFLLFRR